MGEGKGSTLVHLLVIVLSLVAFGFAIAAERQRSVVSPLFLVQYLSPFLFQMFTTPIEVMAFSSLWSVS